ERLENFDLFRERFALFGVARGLVRLAVRLHQLSHDTEALVVGERPLASLDGLELAERDAQDLFFETLPRLEGSPHPLLDLFDEHFRSLMVEARSRNHGAPGEGLGGAPLMIRGRSRTNVAVSLPTIVETYRLTRKVPDLPWNLYVCRPVAAVVVHAASGTRI